MASHASAASGRNSVTPVAIAALGAATLVVSLPFGPPAIAAASVLFLGTCVLALVGTHTNLLTWVNGLVTLVALIWFVPIRVYQLPFNLPFQLEPYRVYLLVLCGALAGWVLLGRGRLDFAGAGRQLLLLAAVAVATQILNYRDLNAGAGEDVALKSLSFFISFILVFVLFASTLTRIDAAERLLAVLVGGGTVVALFAVYEGRTGYNVFDHLAEFVPILEQVRSVLFEARGGNLRVYASAQHPIALAVALGMMIPLALYLASRARSQAGRNAWLAAGGVLVIGVASTVSRTTVLMFVAMLAVGVVLRGRAVARFWPLLLVLPFLIHVLSPGSLGGIYKSLNPQAGLVSDLQGRAGQTGSGRLADFDPALQLWRDSPAVGIGLGSRPLVPPATASPLEGAPLIFDNQYLSTLVSTGAVGLAAVLWFLWGSIVRMFSRARVRGPGSDLVAACCISCLGFAVSMLVFDAFAFVQVTLMFMIVAAIGLRVIEITRLDTPEGAT